MLPFMRASALELLMSPVTDCLDEASLRALVELRAYPEAADRIRVLAEKCNEGELSVAERAEYETCVMFGNFLGVLQAKARRKLRDSAWWPSP
jgi:hypothetical protein